MSLEGTAVSSASNGAGAPPPPAPVADDGGGDESALLAKSQAILSGDDEIPAEETPTQPDAGKPKPAEEKKTEETPDEAQLSRAFARLRSEQKRFDSRKLEQSQKYMADVEKLKTERESFEKERSGFTELQARARREPLMALKALGWDYENLVKYVADGNIPMAKIQEDFRVELDERGKKAQADLEAYRKELDELKSERQREQMIQEAQAYEGRVLDEMEGLIKSQPEKFKHLARVPRERSHRAILNHMIEHFEKNNEALALSDAMLYAEQEAKSYAAWFASQEAASPGGAVQSANPGAAKPETPEARPISQRETTVRGVQHRDLNTLTDDEREELTRRILSGEADAELM